MRQAQLSDWLTEFADNNCKVVQASYLETLKKMMEQKSGGVKFATIEDALDNFCSRLDIPRPVTNMVTAGFISMAFSKDDIDKMVGQGMPSEAIMNELGSTLEEKTAIESYVKTRQEQQQYDNSEIVRDMSLSDDQVKTTPSMPSKMSSLRNLSTRK